MRTRFRQLICLLTLALLLLPARARAIAATAQRTAVHDNGSFFSPDAAAKAEAEIADIKKQFGKDLRVETYAQIPPDIADKFDSANPGKFFTQWARRHAKDAGVD